MGAELRSILGSKNMSGRIQLIKSGVPDKILPPAALTVGRKILGDYATVIEHKGRRTLMPIIQYGAASRATKQRGANEKQVKLFHSFNHTDFNPLVLQQLLKPDSTGTGEIDVQAKEEISHQLVEAEWGQRNTRISSIYSVLLKGIVYLDAEGMILSSSSGAQLTLDMGVPSGNKSQLDIFGDTDPVITQSWANPDSDIPTMLRNLKTKALRQHGYVPMCAFYTNDIPACLMKNTAMKRMMIGNNTYQSAFLQGEVPDLFGMKWRPISDAFFVSAETETTATQTTSAASDTKIATETETFKTWAASSTVVFCPDFGPEWYELIEGSYLIPSDIGGIRTDANDAMASLRTEYGMFSYAKVLDDPVTLRHYVGDTWIPFLKIPSAVYQATVIY